MKRLFFLVATFIISVSGYAQALPDTVWCQKVGQVNVVKFTPDGKYVIAGVIDGIARMYDAKSGALVKSFQLVKGGITDLDISPTGDTLAVCGGDGLVRFFNVQTGAFIKYLDSTKTILSSDISFSPNGKMLVFNDSFRGVYLKNLETDSIVFSKTGLPYSVSLVDFSALDLYKEKGYLEQIVFAHSFCHSSNFGSSFRSHLDRREELED